MALQSRGQGTKAHSVRRDCATFHGEGALHNEQLYFSEVLRRFWSLKRLYPPPCCVCDTNTHSTEREWVRHHNLVRHAEAEHQHSDTSPVQTHRHRSGDQGRESKQVSHTAAQCLLIETSNPALAKQRGWYSLMLSSLLSYFMTPKERNKKGCDSVGSVTKRNQFKWWLMIA